MKAVIEKIDKDVNYIIGQINPAANNPSWNVSMAQLAVNLTIVSEYLHNKLSSGQQKEKDKKNDSKR